MIGAVVWDLEGVLLQPGASQPDPALGALLGALRARGVTLALLSNAGARAATLRQALPFLQPFQLLLTWGETGIPKPDSAAFRVVEQRLALPPAALLLVDDAPHNVRAARRCGWQAHLFQDAPTLRAELRAWDLITGDEQSLC